MSSEYFNETPNFEIKDLDLKVMDCVCGGGGGGGG